MEFSVTRQCDIFQNIRYDQRFHIFEDLLFDCVGLGYGHRPNRAQGFNSEKSFGYALLTFFCEERIYTYNFGDTEKYKDHFSIKSIPN